MKTKTLTLEQIRIKGSEVLLRELGPVDMIRFFQQFETGSGDYSKDRHRWLEDLDVETLAEQIRQRRDHEQQANREGL